MSLIIHTTMTKKNVKLEMPRRNLQSSGFGVAVPPVHMPIDNGLSFGPGLVKHAMICQLCSEQCLLESSKTGRVQAWISIRPRRVSKFWVPAR